MAAMTIGTLSRRTGIPVKALRAYEDMGLLYTMGRSPGNYRLFDDEALWCAAVIALLNLAPHLPERGNLAVDGLAALAAAAWCGLNFWRCRPAHCIVTSTGWAALSGGNAIGCAGQGRRTR